MESAANTEIEQLGRTSWVFLGTAVVVGCLLTFAAYDIILGSNFI